MKARNWDYWRGRMWEYLLTMLIILCLNFFLPRLMPGDPFTYLSGTGSGSDLGVLLDSETEAKLRAYYGL
ncbi:MAG: ABC transporter permease, partial [bacterium]